MLECRAGRPEAATFEQRLEACGGHAGEGLCGPRGAVHSLHLLLPSLTCGGDACPAADGQSGRRDSDSPQTWRDLSKFPEHLKKKLGLPRLELPLLPRLTLCLQMTFHSAPAPPLPLPPPPMPTLSPFSIPPASSRAGDTPGLPWSDR